jgi:hypothetical protein
MSEQTDLQQSPPPEFKTTASSHQESANEADQDKSIYSVIALCSLGIVACFFLPWIRLLFADLSGYQLQQLPSDTAKLLWLIPLTGFISVVASITKQSVGTAAQFAGVMPFLALLYYGSKIGRDISDILRPGAYLTLLLAAVLLIAPRFLKKTKQ